jgi:hypothetical protein
MQGVTGLCKRHYTVRYRKKRKEIKDDEQE